MVANLIMPVVTANKKEADEEAAKFRAAKYPLVRTVRRSARAMGCHADIYCIVVDAATYIARAGVR